MAEAVLYYLFPAGCCGEKSQVQQDEQNHALYSLKDTVVL